MESQVSQLYEENNNVDTTHGHNEGANMIEEKVERMKDNDG